jgi:hypothetical protein
MVHDKSPRGSAHLQYGLDSDGRDDEISDDGFYGEIDPNKPTKKKQIKRHVFTFLLLLSDKSRLYCHMSIDRKYIQGLLCDQDVVWQPESV